MTLKLYLDLMSQPSRAVHIFLRAAGIPFEAVPVALRKGAHRQSDFLKINRFGRVPAIDDNGFKLSESVAILRYLARQYSVDDHWYPKDTIGQARVDEFLEWQHLDLRAPCANFFRIKVLGPKMTGKDPSPSTIEKSFTALQIALDLVEEKWLDGRLFLTGNKISIADILAACEMEQPRMAGYNIFQSRPNLTQWFNRIRSELGPYYEEANILVNKFIAANQSKL